MSISGKQLNRSFSSTCFCVVVSQTLVVGLFVVWSFGGVVDSSGTETNPQDTFHSVLGLIDSPLTFSVY